LPVAALILGIFATVFSLSVVLFFLGIPIGLVAVVIGVLARKRAIAASQPTGAATAGVVLGVVAVIVGLVLYAACSYVNKQAKSEFDRLAHDPKLQQQNHQFEETVDKMLAPTYKPDGGSKK
jgi:membrane protein DedA with SNARE-associated domain